jgi:regulator of nucleoside diphosphate kinase
MADISSSSNPSGGSLQKPEIAIPEEDLDRLSGLAAAAFAKTPDVAEYLESEIERAKILPRGASSEHVVRMGGRAVYRDETTGAIHDITLVYPHEADIEQGRVSVLTPVGAALLGLRPGQSIHWTTRSGETRRLTILVGPDLGAD